jgi:hypothetical protein
MNRIVVLMVRRANDMLMWNRMNDNIDDHIGLLQGIETLA